MSLSEGIVIVLISQVPLALYTIWSGIKRHKPEIKKLDAETKSHLSDAVEGAGQTLVEAWKHIKHLDEWKRNAQIEIDPLKEELRRFRNAYAKAIRYISNRLPGEEVPNFMDTQELVKRDK